MQTHQQSFFLVGVIACFFVFITSTSFVEGQIPLKPTLTADKQAVQEGATGVKFNCIGFTYNNSTNVTFFSNGFKLFDSATNVTCMLF